jgi:endonuclease/exonuclease/phosphatase family metal-dependent hydrolase
MSVLRCLTLNLWGAEPPLEARMKLIAEGIRALAPDVVALQEVCSFPDLPNQAETLARETGLSFVFAPATPFRSGQEGLAILSRPPVVAHESRELPHASPLERRILLTAGLAVGDRTVWVHVTHLNYRLTHGRQREDQVLAIDELVAARKDVEPQILMGDFNARPESDEIRWLCGLTSLRERRTVYQDAWGRLHPGDPGWTWASANPYTRALNFLQPDRRLDYIFVTPERRDGRGRILDCRMVFDQPTGGVYPSDHYGLFAEVQITPDPAAPPVVS